MSENKIKILGVAPYASMKSLMVNVAGQFPNIDLTTYVGDLEEGAQIVKESTDNYDIIISRGGTAELISHFSTIPVLDISISVYDILRAVKLADNYGKKYAIVGFPSITDPSTTLCDLLQYDITIITIHSQDETMEVLKKLQKDGYRMILGDNIVASCAKQLGLNSLLITSGTESISTVFRRAITFCQNSAGIWTELSVIRSSFKGQSSSTLIFNEQGDLIFSCLHIDDLETASAVTNRLKSEITDCKEVEKKKFFINIKERIFSVSSYSYQEYNRTYLSFHIWSNDIPISGSRKGIRIRNSGDITEINSLFEVLGSNQDLLAQIKKMEQHTMPIVLMGEKGTGKSHLASLIHLQSPLKNNPIIEIDCEMLTSRTWSYLVGNYNSPFMDSNNTLYFHSIGKLDEEQRNQLMTLIIDSNLCGRNRVIFSFDTPSPKGSLADIYDFIHKFTCITLSLSPLRDNIRDIPNITSLYLSALNISLGKGLVGLEPEALDLLQSYSWPYNLSQFKRLLYEIALVTDGAYITAESVMKLLSKEPSYHGMPTAVPRTESFLPASAADKTLEQLTKEMILAALAKNNGNQTLTAKQLGIGRSTIWRYLK